MASKNYQFASADESLQKQISQRGERGGIIVKDLIENYLSWVWPSLFQSAKVSKNEFLALCDLFNGTMLHSSISPRASIRMNVLDAASDGYDEKWDCDWQGLISKIADWDDANSFAVLDAIQKFWNDSETYAIPDIDKQLKKIGVYDLLFFEELGSDD